MEDDHKEPLGWPILLEFARAADANAKDLIADAEILMEKERWPRAFALAVLAREEFGKGLMALQLMGVPPDWVTPARLRTLQGDHIRKLMSAYEHEGMTSSPELHDDYLRRSRETAHRANLDKQRAFYVDFAEDGSVRQPSQISEDEARSLVAQVHQMIHTPGLRSMPFWLPPIFPRGESQAEGKTGATVA